MRHSMKTTLLMLASLLASACAPNSSVEHAYNTAGTNTFAAAQYTRSIFSSNDF